MNTKQNRRDRGFTITEMIVTSVVIAIIVPLFIQVFIVSQTQKGATLRRAEANNQAVSNLSQYPTRAQVETLKTVANPSLDVTCSNANDLTVTTTDGTEVLFEGRTDSQRMYIAYPRGCSVKMPARITTTVSFNNGYSTETIKRATYVTDISN